MINNSIPLPGSLAEERGVKVGQRVLAESLGVDGQLHIDAAAQIGLGSREYEMESTITLADCLRTVVEGANGASSESVWEDTGLVELQKPESCPAAGGGCEPLSCPNRKTCNRLVNEWIIRRGQYQRPDVTIYDRLEIASRFHDPEREWGRVTRLAEEYNLSRVTIQTIADRVAWLFAPRLPGLAVCPGRILPCGGSLFSVVEVVRELRREEEKQVRGRLILTSVFPGGVTMRPLEDILEETPLVESRSAPTVWRFVNQAGVKASQILAEVDYAGVKATLLLVQIDETFFNGQPILFVVEPISLSVVGHNVPLDGDCLSKTWGPLLLILQEDQHLDLFGGVGDGAKLYPGVFKLILGREDGFQEDVFHPVRDMHSLRRKLENSAYRAFRAEYKADEELKANDTSEAQEKLSQAKTKSVRQAEVHSANFHCTLEASFEALLVA